MGYGQEMCSLHPEHSRHRRPDKQMELIITMFFIINWIERDQSPHSFRNGVKNTAVVGSGRSFFPRAPRMWVQDRVSNRSLLFLLKIFLITERVDYEGKNVTLKLDIRDTSMRSKGTLPQEPKASNSVNKFYEIYASSPAQASEAKPKRCVRRRH